MKKKKGKVKVLAPYPELELSVKTRVYPSESQEKVEQAIKNIFPEVNLEVAQNERGEKYLFGTKKGGASILKKFYIQLRSQRILDVARKKLIGNMVGETTAILLHKQAAFMSKVNFCGFEDVGPLGGIEVAITSSDIQTVIDWLAPQTVKGKEVKMVTDIQF